MKGEEAPHLSPGPPLSDPSQRGGAPERALTSEGKPSARPVDAQTKKALRCLQSAFRLLPAMTFPSFRSPPLLSNADFPLAGGAAGEALIGRRAVTDSRRAAAPSRSPARPRLGERTCAIRGRPPCYARRQGGGGSGSLSVCERSRAAEATGTRRSQGRPRGRTRPGAARRRRALGPAGASSGLRGRGLLGGLAAICKAMGPC